MSGTELLLYLVVAPGAVIAVIWALASAGGPHARKRYRPGRPYDLAPVWYLANRPEPGPEQRAGSDVEVPSGAATGGASDRW